MRKIFVVGGSIGYANWMQGELSDFKNSDLVVFTGGEDVDPSIYGEPKGGFTHSNIRRDQMEKAWFDLAIESEKKIIGICRGAQLICALSGGRLIQDQPNNSFLHEMETFEGIPIVTSSCHHQAMYPFSLPEDEYKILGWTENKLFYHDDGEVREMNPPKECEIVLFPKMNALGIQGHPEMQFYYEKDSIEYFQYLLNLHMQGHLA